MPGLSGRRWTTAFAATIPVSPVTSVSVLYTGEINSLVKDYPSWTPVSSYAGGTVSNAPLPADGVIQLYGTGVTDTVSFSTPVLNPVMSIWSLGSPVRAAEFVFTAAEPFTIEAGGPDSEYGGSAIYTLNTLPTTVFGEEGNGTVQFNGVYSSITWTNPINEGWYGITIGLDAVAAPEPSAAFGFVLAAAVAMTRRRRHK